MVGVEPPAGSFVERAANNPQDGVAVPGAVQRVARRLPEKGEGWTQFRDLVQELDQHQVVRAPLCWLRAWTATHRASASISRWLACRGTVTRRRARRGGAG